jgi:hypothetical protein
VDDDTIIWKKLTDTPRAPKWPGSLICRRDPGDLASSDWGTRSPAKLDLNRSHSAVLTCSHHKLTIWVVNEEPPLPKRDLARLLLYVASVGRACDCYRGPWLELFGENFCRATAIRTWRWLEDTIAHANVWAWWWRRNPPGREWHVYSAYVDDGLLFPRSKYDKPRYPRGPRAHTPQRTKSPDQCASSR